jgi:hypothetical protein
MAHLGPESDSEDDMMGFWGARSGDDASDYSEETESDDEESNGALEQDDDDDEDEIALFGHR